MASFFDATTVVVESTLLPELRLNVGEQVDAPQSLLVRLLRPKVTIYQGGAKFASLAPAGDPAQGLPLKALLLAAAAVGVFLWVKR